MLTFFSKNPRKFVPDFMESCMIFTLSQMETPIFHSVPAQIPPGPDDDIRSVIISLAPLLIPGPVLGVGPPLLPTGGVHGGSLLPGQTVHGIGSLLGRVPPYWADAQRNPL